MAERKNREMATEGTILQSAINTGISAFGKDGGKRAHGVFQDLIKSLLIEMEDANAPQKGAHLKQPRGKP